MIIYDSAGRPYNTESEIPESLIEPELMDMPKIFFTGTFPTSKDDGELLLRIEYYSKKQSWSCWSTLKVQGNSSVNFPKKNFTLKLFKDSEKAEKKKVDFKGWGKQSKFVLKANWIDIMHCRNIVGARLWTQLQESRKESLPQLLQESPRLGAVDGFPVKIYLNGVYQGRYTLNIPKDKWTFNMDDSLDTNVALCGENNNEGSAATWNASSDNIDESNWSDEIHDTVPQAVITAFNRVLTFVNESSDERFVSNIDDYIDLDSLIDYWILHILAGDADAYGKNQLWLSYDLAKWYISSYDMDHFFGMDWQGNLTVTADSGYPASIASRSKLIKRLVANFGTEITARYQVLRSGILSEGNVIRQIEQFTDICPIDLVREDYASTTAGGAYTNIPTKDNANNTLQMRQWVVQRFALMDTLVPDFGVVTTES